MTHDSTWLSKTRVIRRMRLTAPLGLLLVCVLLAGLLPATAAATSNYDMRGEWTIIAGATHDPATPGVCLIGQEELVSGTFSGTCEFDGNLFSGTISGTVSGTGASVTVVIPAAGITYITPSATIDTTTNSVSGAGTYYKEGVEFETGPLTLTRTKTYLEVQEREARELKEREEREARENVRGEWALTLKFGSETTKGTALITEPANSKNDFASDTTLFEGVVPGTFSGILEGSNATVTVTTEAFGEIPASEFTSNTMALTTGAGSFSMTGSGTFTVGTLKIPGELTATRIHTYAEVKDREAQEQEAKEKQEKEAAEAKRAKEAKEAEEARAKQAQEAQEKLEKEAALQQIVTSYTQGKGNPVTLLSAEPGAKTFTVGSSGSLSLGLANPNDFAVHGHLTLVAASTASAGKASAAKSKKKAAVSFGSASFTISADGHSSVKIKLSGGARADLASHKTVRIEVTIATSASGMQGVSKTYTITLRAPASHHGKS